jgi:hypothetical protein
VPYLLDGDNLVGAALGRRGEAERDALVSEIAGRLRRTKARVVLYFDGPGRGSSLGNLTVRFSGASSADDAIVREIAASPRAGETTVVTADRELSRRARDAGAKVVTPAEFWGRFGAEAKKGDTRPEEKPVDVEDWLRWFAEKGDRED